MISIVHPLLGAEEAAAVLRVLASGQIAQGEQVATFERRFAEICHVREATAGSSGTAALSLALLAYGVGPGDEVVTTALPVLSTICRPQPELAQHNPSGEGDVALRIVRFLLEPDRIQ